MIRQAQTYYAAALSAAALNAAAIAAFVVLTLLSPALEGFSLSDLIDVEQSSATSAPTSSEGGVALPDRASADRGRPNAPRAASESQARGGPAPQAKTSVPTDQGRGSEPTEAPVTPSTAGSPSSSGSGGAGISLPGSGGNGPPRSAPAAVGDTVSGVGGAEVKGGTVKGVAAPVEQAAAPVKQITAPVKNIAPVTQAIAPVKSITAPVKSAATAPVEQATASVKAATAPL